jgi:cellulose synthase/poly-beta-1,6-N-acetylglucosamine synthase-like glycosyltransferase
VSVVVPAYRESRVIASKVRDVLDNDYPGTVEVVVVPEDDETAAAAAETAATVVPFVERTGKAGALNRGVAAAAHEVVVLTDANARFSPAALERLVAWLDDPAFGAAGARKLVDGEGLYWRFEDWLKRAEMRHGSSIALDGAVLALRRAEYRPIPEDVVVDDLWLALDVVERGQAIAYDHEVVCEEEGFPALRDDWERRTRIVAGNVDALWRRRDRLRPGANGAFQLWGHRAVRSSVGPVSHLTLLALCLARSTRSRSSRRFVLLHAVLGALAAGGRVRRDASRPERLAYQVLFLQAVGLGGTFRFLRGDRPSRWDKQERVPMPSHVD